MRDDADLPLVDTVGFHQPGSGCGGVGENQSGAVVGGGIVGASEGEVLQVVFAKIVRGDDQGNPMSGKGEIEDESCAAKLIPSVAKARVIGLRPVKMQEVGTRLAKKAGQREDALVMAEKADFDVKTLQCFREQPLIRNAIAPVWSEENVHYVFSTGKKMPLRRLTPSA